MVKQTTGQNGGDGVKTALANAQQGQGTQGYIAPASARGTSATDPEKMRVFLDTRNPDRPVVAGSMVGWNRADLPEGTDEKTIKAVRNAPSARWEKDDKGNYVIDGYDNCPLPYNQLFTITTATDPRTGHPLQYFHMSYATLDLIRDQRTKRPNERYGEDFIIVQDPVKKTSARYSITTDEKTGKKTYYDANGKQVEQSEIERLTAMQYVISQHEYEQGKKFDENKRKALGYNRDYNGIFKPAEDWLDKHLPWGIGRYLGRLIFGIPKMIEKMFTCENFWSLDTLYDVLTIGGTAAAVIGGIHLFKDKDRGGGGGGSDGPTLPESDPPVNSEQGVGNNSYNNNGAGDGGSSWKANGQDITGASSASSGLGGEAAGYAGVNSEKQW